MKWVEEKHIDNLPFYFAFASASAGFVSIAASQILLGAAVVSLFWYRDWRRAPRVWTPLALFFVLTLSSLALSEDPRAGVPLIKKFYVWLSVFVVFSGIRTLRDARWLAAAMAGMASLSGLWGLVQFAMKYQRAIDQDQPFYQFYIADRITGFMSHWMTFGGHMMIGLLISAAYLLFVRDKPFVWFWAACAAICASALVLSFTRSMWGAAGAGIFFLVWQWKRWAVLVIPLILVGVVFFAPEPIHTRIQSFWKPDKKLDSNEHRVVLRRTGMRMIQAHPWFGLGPECVKRHVLDYLPPDVQQPLPAEWWYGHLHNIYIQAGAELGIPAALALIAFLVMPVWDFLRALRRLRPGERERRFLLVAACAVTIGIAVGGWWERDLGDSEVLSTFLAAVAFGYTAANPEEPTEEAG